ncbi:hypothetical protein A2U01_0034725 [Trifolium medium]|uniref:Uncharacterized protein n=1 Tax=Trifolium medium TaxID=97028 RepID=A0A392PQN2_9FABA|nr:hypothetical protein [Trifolium medium]
MANRKSQPIKKPISETSIIRWRKRRVEAFLSAKAEMMAEKMKEVNAKKAMLLDGFGFGFQDKLRKSTNANQHFVNVESLQEIAFGFTMAAAAVIGGDWRVSIFYVQ